MNSGISMLIFLKLLFASLSSSLGTLLNTHTSYTGVVEKGRVSATSLSAKETNRWSVWPPSGASSSLQLLRAAGGAEGNWRREVLGRFPRRAWGLGVGDCLPEEKGGWERRRARLGGAAPLPQGWETKGCRARLRLGEPDPDGGSDVMASSSEKPLKRRVWVGTVEWVPGWDRKSLFPGKGQPLTDFWAKITRLSVQLSILVPLENCLGTEKPQCWWRTEKEHEVVLREQGQQNSAAAGKWSLNEQLRPGTRLLGEGTLEPSHRVLNLHRSLLFSRWVLWPNGLQHARLPFPSVSPRVCSDSCLLSRGYYLTVSPPVTPLLLLPSIFPSMRVFSSKSAVIRWLKYWTIRKAECWRIDAFEMWWWRRLLRVPWTARRSNQSVLKEISPEYSLEWLMLKLKFQYFGHLCEELTPWKRPWCWELLKAGWEGDDRGWEGWMASLTQ